VYDRDSKGRADKAQGQFPKSEKKIRSKGIDKGRYEEIRKKYSNIFYLDPGDYNKYYMPNNTITDTFLETKEEQK